MNSDDLKILCVIPARGNSKRLPSKNKMMFEGKPMLSYTIEAALDSRIFSKVILSSEDDDALNVGKAYPELDVQKRPDALSTDTSSVLDVCNHILDMEGENFDYVCILLATSPLRNAEHIKEAFQMLNDDVDSIIGATEYYYHPYKALIAGEDGYVKFGNEAGTKVKGQVAEKFFVINGSLVFLRPRNIRDNTYYPPKTRVYQMPRWASIDIDEKEDFEIARAFYRHFVLKED